MDELQATFSEGRLFIWGISSDKEEMFVPKERIEKLCKELFSLEKPDRRIIKIEMPAIENKIIAPPSMMLFYEQFEIKNPKIKIFSVNAVEVDSSLLINNFLQQEKKQGILFGDSYEFFRLLLSFAFSLVVRQRFVPFYKNKCLFISNYDNSDDFEALNELIKKAPLIIKLKVSDSIEELIKETIEHFINIIISSSLEQTNINIINETDSDKWLNGLLGKKDIKVSNNIEEGLKQWLIVKRVNQDLEYNTLFKLEEPLDKKAWPLSFNLQSKKDPSLIYRLDEVWSNRNRVNLPNAKIHLLQELGAAAKVSKIIEKALFKPNPYKADLTDEEVIEFISKDSFLLKDSGFSIQIPKIVPAKINESKVRIKFKAADKFKIGGTGMLGDQLFDFDYSVALGEVELSEEEFYELSKSKEKLVNVKGKWVEVNNIEIKKIIDFLNNREKMSLAETITLNSSNELGLEIDDVIVPKEFKAHMAGLFDFKSIEDVKVPENFVGTLREYQKEGLNWMTFLRKIGFGGILADDMGLGKTIQAIAYLLLLNDEKNIQKKDRVPSLVICPTSVIGNWEREVQIFSPTLKVNVYHGSSRLNKKEFINKIKEYDIVISSYSTVRVDEELFHGIEWETLFLDEAQNIKNPMTKQAISISKIKSKCRFSLTGTPVENRISELWSIMNFVNPGFLSNWNKFKKNFAEPIELDGNKQKQELLKKIINPFILRRLKTDKKIINDLPNKTEIKEYCTLTKEQASIYQAIVDDSLRKIKNEEKNRRALIMATLIKLKQVCNHPSNYLKDSANLQDRSGKVKRLRELIEIILENKEKCLIFTQYKEMGELLKTDLENYFDTPVCFLHGEQSRKKREELIGCFQSDDETSPKIFILSLKAGGTGINLTKANHVIHFDRWWNPAVENQATDRAFRIGQRKDVFVYKFITGGTIEEKIDEMIERKLSLSVSLLSKGEMAITEFDNNQLKELLSLRIKSFEEPQS